MSGVHFRYVCDDQSHLHHGAESGLRVGGAPANDAGKPEDGRRLRELLHPQNVLLPIRQLLLLHILHRLFQGER